MSYIYTPPTGKIYKCSYEYSGMETEGAVYTYPDFYCRGETPAHALHKYQFWLTLNGMMKATENLETYLTHYYAGGGWGFFTEEATYNCNFFSDTIYPNWEKLYNDGNPTPPSTSS